MLFVLRNDQVEELHQISIREKALFIVLMMRAKYPEKSHLSSDVMAPQISRPSRLLTDVVAYVLTVRFHWTNTQQVATVVIFDRVLPLPLLYGLYHTCSSYRMNKQTSLGFPIKTSLTVTLER